MDILGLITQILIFIFFGLHMVYFIVGILVKPQTFSLQKTKRRFDFLIVARNEALVIGDLIDSIKQQHYPQDLIRIFVLADNCQDQTAAIAKAHGAITFENQFPNKKGKGIALQRLIHLRNTYPGQPSDGVFFFDADNILGPDFTTKMNDAYQNDDTILIGYRGSKNFANNATSMGSSIIFFREAHFLHHARNRLGLSTHINGTGFMLPNPIVSQEPWEAFSLIEDIEFTILQLIKDRKVLFVRDAKFYDEQPITSEVSFKQRLRWIKGSIQIFFLHAGKLLASLMKKFRFSKVDLLLWITPFPSVIVILSMVNLILHQVAVIQASETFTIMTLMPTYEWLFNYLSISFIIGLMTVIASWKEVNASVWHKLKAIVTFPFFTLSFLPLFILAPFTMFNLSWYKTPHTVNKSSPHHDPAL